MQTIGSAGESIAAGVVFTLPGLLFLARRATASVGLLFAYWTIFTLALLGGVLGMLMMIPLRRSLIVKEHGNLPYPEGTACAEGAHRRRKGRRPGARSPSRAWASPSSTRCSRRSSRLIAETPALVTRRPSKIFPSATLNGEITPEYMGVGYIVGPRIAGVLVAGGVLAWLGLIPLLASLVPPDAIASQLVKLGYLPTSPASGAMGSAAHNFATPSSRSTARTSGRSAPARWRRAA